MSILLRVYLSVSGLIIICISFLLHFKTLSVPTFAHLADCIYRLLIDITCLSFQMFYHSWQHLASLRHCTTIYLRALPTGSHVCVPCFVAACHHSLQLSLPASRPFLASSLGGASFVASSLSAYGHLKNWYV